MPAIIIIVGIPSCKDYNVDMARVPANRDPEFLEAVSRAFSRYLSEHPDLSQIEVAAQLEVAQTTISNYIRKTKSIDGEILSRACVRLGMSFEYKGLIISATAFRSATVLMPAQPAPQQLSFSFDARYQNGTSEWKVSHASLEPFELLLRIKAAV